MSYMPDNVWIAEHTLNTYEINPTDDTRLNGIPQEKVFEYTRADLAPKWQVIDTAPKDRKIFLGYFNTLGYWRTVTGKWFDYIDYRFGDDTKSPDGWYEISENADEECNVWRINPTHWMPLPKPPEGI